MPSRLMSDNAVKALIEAYNGAIDNHRQLLVLRVWDGMGTKIPHIVELPLQEGVEGYFVGLSSETRKRINELRKIK